MKITTVAMAKVATIVAAGAAAIGGASAASADVAADVNSHQLGNQITVTNGDVVQGWTVSNLKPSTDVIPYQPHGTLWEATATDEAIRGSVIPIVSNFDARAANGQNYPVLYGVASPQGVNPATLAQGQKTGGKLYFDVTGDKPNHIVYAEGSNVLATWIEPAPGGPGSARGSGGSNAGGRSGALSPAGDGTTPSAKAAPAGSQGTPLPSGSQGTPLNPGSPAPPATGPETPAGTPATPAPGAGPETPAGTPATPAPGPGPAAPATPAAVVPGAQDEPGAVGTPASNPPR